MKKLLTLMLATAVIAGCGGSDDSSEPPVGQSGSDGGTGSAQETGDGTVGISMKGIQFVPKEQTVKVGQKIVWTNEDDAQHDADATKGADFDTDLIGKGGKIEYTPDKGGTIEYVCSVHPSMTGTLTVEE
jgi:plastocyanin